MKIEMHGLGLLTDQDLLLRTRALIQTGCELEAELLLLLGEIDERRLYLERAFPSMFVFCTGELGFSEDAAYNRISVARVARRFPAVLEELRTGRAHLSGLRLLAPHLTDDNHRALLEEARGKSKRSIEELVARIAPKPAAPALIRKLPEPTVAPAPAPAASPAVTSTPASLPLAVAGSPAPAPPTSPVPARTDPRPTVQPLNAEAYKVQFTASRALRDKLREAQDLLRHQAGGDLAVVVERALDLLIAQVKKERFAVCRKPQERRATSAKCGSQKRPSRYVAAAIRRAVFERDQGRCAFVDEQGRRCPETGGLELDHLDGFARTGTHSVDRIRLACKAHNAHAADQMYGRDFMERARARAKRRERAQELAPGRVAHAGAASEPVAPLAGSAEHGAEPP